MLAASLLLGAAASSVSALDDPIYGDEAWKKEWTNGSRDLRHIAVINKTLRGYLAFTLLVGPRWYFRRFDYAHAIYGFWQDITRSLRKLARG